MDAKGNRNPERSTVKVGRLGTVGVNIFGKGGKRHCIPMTMPTLSLMCNFKIPIREILEHSPYSSSLVPCNYKAFRRVLLFNLDDEVKEGWQDFLKNLPTFFLE
ncbi:hypothetical protein TNCV_4763261 [Trichonephila clavipes]|nr:hypothetical protein TNCV_4763261 [Trichonephila clavipes]